MPFFRVTVFKENAIVSFREEKENAKQAYESAQKKGALIFGEAPASIRVQEET